MLTQEKN